MSVTIHLQTEADLQRLREARQEAPSVRDKNEPEGTRTALKSRRKSFAVEQLIVLECYFAQCRYLRGQRRLQLARQLNLTDAQVKVW